MLQVPGTYRQYNGRLIVPSGSFGSCRWHSLYILVYKDPSLSYLLVSMPSILTLRYMGNGRAPNWIVGIPYYWVYKPYEIGYINPSQLGWWVYPLLQGNSGGLDASNMTIPSIGGKICKNKKIIPPNAWYGHIMIGNTCKNLLMSKVWEPKPFL